jgi:hypothetical protein
MKILQLDSLYYKLPEDFKGTLSDALRDLATFIETPSESLPKTTVNIDEDPWGAFDEVNTNGGRFSGIVGLKRLINDKWESLPMGILEDIPAKEQTKPKKPIEPYAQHSADECDDETCSHY